MSRRATRKEERSETGQEGKPAAVSNQRVDSPHVTGDAAPPESTTFPASPTTAESVAAEGSSNADDVDAAVQIVQQVRAQASQLAGHLRRQQAALDHREAELNARVGAMESQFRNARLWLSEHQQEFAETRVGLDRRQKEVDARAAELAKGEAACKTLRETTEQELRRREAAVETREAVLASRLAEVTAAGDAAKQTWTQANDRFQQQTSTLGEREAELKGIKGELQARISDIENRCLQLDVAESRLADEHAELERARETFYREHAHWQEDVASARHKLREDREQFARDVDKKKQSFRRRRDDLAGRRASLKQLQGEVMRTQRETLEMRLATEEIWARLCGTMAPAALTQSLGQLRLKMADQNRLAGADLAEQRAELQALSAGLAEQHEKVGAQRKELREWMTRRMTEIEHQAAVLVAREQELDRQERDMRDTLRQHSDERRAYQQEIRRLLRQLRQPETAAA